MNRSLEIINIWDVSFGRNSSQDYNRPWEALPLMPPGLELHGRCNFSSWVERSNITRGWRPGDRQNVYRIAIPVRAVVVLAKLAEREQEISRQMLAISISHNARGIHIYCNYPVYPANETSICCQNMSLANRSHCPRQRQTWMLQVCQEPLWTLGPQVSWVVKPFLGSPS